MICLIGNFSVAECSNHIFFNVVSYLDFHDTCTYSVESSLQSLSLYSPFPPYKTVPSIFLQALIQPLSLTISYICITSMNNAQVSIFSKISLQDFRLKFVTVNYLSSLRQPIRTSDSLPEKQNLIPLHKTSLSPNFPSSTHPFVSFYFSLFSSLLFQIVLF